MADNNDGQSGCLARGCVVFVNAGFQFVFQVKRDLFSVDNEHGDRALLCRFCLSGELRALNIQAYSYEKFSEAANRKSDEWPRRVDEGRFFVSGECREVINIL